MTLIRFIAYDYRQGNENRKKNEVKLFDLIRRVGSAQDYGQSTKN
jgi:hypothetical protein